MKNTHVRAAVTVTYGETGRMNATYDAGAGEPTGRGLANGYDRTRPKAAAEAAVKAVENWAAQTGRNLAADAGVGEDLEDSRCRGVGSAATSSPSCSRDGRGHQELVRRPVRRGLHHARGAREAMFAFSQKQVEEAFDGRPGDHLGAVPGDEWRSYGAGLARPRRLHPAFVQRMPTTTRPTDAWESKQPEECASSTATPTPGTGPATQWSPTTSRRTGDGGRTSSPGPTTSPLLPVGKRVPAQPLPGRAGTTHSTSEWSTSSR